MIDDIELEIMNCFKCKNIYGVSLNKPKSFYGGNYPKVIIIGHSPTVRVSEKAEVVLKMDKPNRQIYKYINNDILNPLGIKIEDVYCTNLIKCYTKNLPEEEIKKDNMYINNVFNNCSRMLEKEIKIIKPKLIISLSGRVFEILSERYTGKKLKIRENFGLLNTLKISDMSIKYIPVIHIPKYQKVKNYYFPEQTHRLNLIRDSINIL